jgi:mono/diheme cytochrome c family protein
MAFSLRQNSQLSTGGSWRRERGGRHLHLTNARKFSACPKRIQAPTNIKEISMNTSPRRNSPEVRRRWTSYLARGLAGAGVVTGVAAAVVACGGGGNNDLADQLTGKQTFRFDTFGDEAFWTDTLKMNTVIASAVDPTTALKVGLKVDSEALPPEVVAGIKNGSVDLTKPATTVALLKLDAVVGVKGTVTTVNGVDTLTRVGITCALCHSTVDNSFAPGIGKRLDGWPNRDLNPGAIIALSPALDAATKAVYNSWGPGKYDPRFNIDHKNKPNVIPPAYGLQDVNKITVTGDGDTAHEPAGPIAYWNRYVAVTQMGGQGTFSDPRLPLTVTNGTTDLVSSKLHALQAYQLSLPAPTPPAGSFDPAAAGRGKLVFEGAGKCSTCHSGPQFTDANTTLHPVADSMAEPETPSYASRSATKQYRTTPLKGVWQHAPYFHDGSAATLEDVVAVYNTKRSLGLTAQQMADLAQYLKSL